MDKDIVKKGYNKVAKDYASQRDQFKNWPYLEKLSELLPENSRVLDIGCGAGLPIDRFLVDRGHKVTGIDISEKMIRMARKNVPEANYEVKDMADLREKEYEVDAVVSFYAIFHIPRKNHERLFKKINSFLPKGGPILVTMGSSKWEGEEKDFHGAPMWWSHYGIEKNKKIVERTGFKILLDEIDDSSREKHQVIIARKK